MRSELNSFCTRSRIDCTSQERFLVLHVEANCSQTEDCYDIHLTSNFKIGDHGKEVNQMFLRTRKKSAFGTPKEYIER